MQIRVNSISKAFAGCCLVVAALLAAAAVTGCTLDERIKPEDKQTGESIRVRVSGDAAIGKYSTKSGLPSQEHYTIVGSVISGGDFEDETFEVIVMPNCVSPLPDALQSDTRASYGDIQVNGDKKTELINWDEGDRISIFSDVATSAATKDNPGSINPIAYCDFDVEADVNVGSQGLATPVNSDPFKDGLKWKKNAKHRFIGIWPPVDTIAFLTNADALASGTMDLMELRFNVQYPSVQTASYNASTSNASMAVYNKGLGKVVMYSGATITAEQSGSATLDLAFRPAFTTLELQLKSTDASSTMKLNKVTISSQEDYLACKDGQGFTGIIQHGVNTGGNIETTFTIDAASLTDAYCSKIIELTFRDASGSPISPVLDPVKATKLCLMALPHQIGTLTILLDLTVDGETVKRQLDLRAINQGESKWINVPSCSKVIISNLAIPASVDKGLVQKEFSVAPNKTVYFSPGNLQAKLTGSGRAAQWRFAPRQYDVLAESDTSSNTNVASGTNWIDLFAWSGTRNRRVGNPYTEYGLRTSLTGQYGGPYKNWGQYSAVTSNMGYGWNLLTRDEMDYLLNERTEASSKVALATVGDVTGIVILPDVFTVPNHCTFTATSLSSGDYTKNKYSTAGTPGTSGSWTAMEKAGAVFFPNTGTVDNTGAYTSSSTFYQTSSLSYTPLSADNAAVREYYSWGSDGFQVRDAVLGVPVRLSKSTEATADGKPIDYSGVGVTPASKPFSVSPTLKVQFTTSNLMWEGNGSKGRFRLMDKPWTILDNEKAGTVLPDNRTVSDTIGMFKWGTGGGNNIWPWTTETDLTKYVTNWPTWEDWCYDRAFKRYWDWGDNVVYDNVGIQMCAEKEDSRLRTLTIDEWYYLMCDRTVSYARYAFVKLRPNDNPDSPVEGMIIFPDDYSRPSSAPAFTTRQLDTDPSKVDFSLTYSGRSYYREITESEWQAMAAAGAAFLPCAGSTCKEVNGDYKVINATGNESTTEGGSPQCHYWTSTCVLNARTRAVFFSTASIIFDPASDQPLPASDQLKPDQPKSDYMPVRLVYESDYETRSWIHP